MRRLSLIIFFPLTIFFALALLLGACNVVPAPATPLPSPTITPTPAPTATATPLPKILSVPLNAYQAANNTFSIQVPQNWQPFDDGGGVRFQDEADPYTSLTAFYFPLPRGVEPQTFLRDEAQRVIASAQLNDPGSLQLITNDLSEDNRLNIEAVGKFFADQPPQHVRAETWVQNNVLLGLSLMAPEAKWPEIAPIWPQLLQSYQVQQPDPSAVTGLAYVHPGGLFTITVPLYWGIVSEDYDGVLLGDMQGLAQFGVSVEEMDHYPTPQEMEEALKAMLGDAPNAEGYIETDKKFDQPNLRLIQFELPAGDEGIYRTELRTFSDRNLLITTSFSAPPHDWDFFAPDYQLLLESVATRGAAPPDEQTQDEDPLAGLEVGVPMFYLDRNGRLQVSTPIRNFRTRNVTQLSASIKLYDKDDEFLAAESWRMVQKILGKGKTTYLYLALPPETTELGKVAQVKIQLIDAQDTRQEPYPAWEYQTGSADVTDEGDVVIRATLSNSGKKAQKYIFVAALLYDENGNLIFAKTDRQRLPYATPRGQEVDVKITLPGPFAGLATFDVIGEKPLLD